MYNSRAVYAAHGQDDIGNPGSRPFAREQQQSGVFFFIIIVFLFLS